MTKSVNYLRIYYNKHKDLGLRVKPSLLSITIRHTIVVENVTITSGSAVAEGPRDALVSRNSATYKTSHLKTIVWHYLQTDGQTDGQTHDDGIYRA